MVIRLFSIFMILSATSVTHADQFDNLPALRESVVAPGKIIRGGEPPLWQISELQKKYGLKTIISLDSDEKATVKERAVATALGINHIWLPMPSIFYPKDSTVSKVLKAMSDPKNYPLYIHCYHGRDRTGLMVGLYRVFRQKWHPYVAYDEMRKFDFISYNFLYQRYWEDKTQHLLYP